LDTYIKKSVTQLSVWLVGWAWPDYILTWPRSFEQKLKTEPHSNICQSLNLNQQPNPIFKFKFLQTMIFLQNKNSFGILMNYLDNPRWQISNFQNLISCGHLTEHLVGGIRWNLNYCRWRLPRTP
jgi:hypothetical protein